MSNSVICPVPTEQQPANEYQQLTESWFFSWATLSGGKYIRKLLWIAFWGGLVAWPIAAASFDPHKDPIHFGVWGIIGSEVLMIAVLLQLYLAWSYVRDRLHKEMVIYEESGWYDGQSWQKPPEVLMRDRLIVSYQIEPILQRLRRTFAILALWMGICLLTGFIF